MQRCSSSIGTLAAALAKAQGELVNPEKSPSQPSVRMPEAGARRHFAMRHCRVGSISYERSWVGTKLLPSRRRLLIKPPA